MRPVVMTLGAEGNAWVIILMADADTSAAAIASRISTGRNTLNHRTGSGDGAA